MALTTTYPREIEQILSERPAVREIAVVGIPHAELGDGRRCPVALKTCAGVTEDEIRDQS